MPDAPSAPGYEDFGLNYTFLFRVYLALAFLSAALFVSQYHFHVASVTGFWLVPAPCILALPVLYVWSAQQRAQPPGAPPAAPGKPHKD
jgi:hypothetical protein